MKNNFWTKISKNGHCEELNSFRMIAHLFRQFGGHNRRYVLVCSFWRLFTIKIFPFSCWKLIMIFFYFKKIKLPARCCKMAPKWFNLLKTFHCKIFPFSCWKLIMIFIYFKKQTNYQQDVAKWLQSFQLLGQLRFHNETL